MKKNYIKELQNIKSYKTQTKIGKSRFDFSGVDENGVEFILEVKNVPCAYYENVGSEKERKKIDIEVVPKSLNIIVNERRLSRI